MNLEESCAELRRRCDSLHVARVSSSRTALTDNEYSAAPFGPSPLRPAYLATLATLVDLPPSALSKLDSTKRAFVVHCCLRAASTGMTPITIHLRSPKSTRCSGLLKVGSRRSKFTGSAGGWCRPRPRRYRLRKQTFDCMIGPTAPGWPAFTPQPAKPNPIRAISLAPASMYSSRSAARLRPSAVLPAPLAPPQRHVRARLRRGRPAANRTCHRGSSAALRPGRTVGAIATRWLEPTGRRTGRAPRRAGPHHWRTRDSGALPLSPGKQRPRGRGDPRRHALGRTPADRNGAGLSQRDVARGGAHVGQLADPGCRGTLLVAMTVAPNHLDPTKLPPLYRFHDSHGEAGTGHGRLLFFHRSTPSGPIGVRIVVRRREVLLPLPRINIRSPQCARTPGRDRGGRHRGRVGALRQRRKGLRSWRTWSEGRSYGTQTV